MSIKIHHGPDGTYKTSGAIKDDILTVIKSGRTLVTNIRGFSRDNAISVLGAKFVHDDFAVIHIDTDVKEGREKLARFFHWAPKGAFFVIDEVQRIFPPAWKESDLKKLDLLEPQDHLPEDQRRPEDIHTAWDMQRHHNWDFVFTTTNIAKVHKMARLMAKVAVRHVNVGIWRFYKTVEHGAESNGKTQADITTVKIFNWIPQKIFKLYASTTTGTFENTEPRTAFYKDPKVAALLLILVSLLAYIASKPAPKALGGGAQADKTPVQQSTDPLPVQTTEANTNTSNRLPFSSQNREFTDRNDTLETVSTSYLAQFNRIYLNGYNKSSEGVIAVFSGHSELGEFQFSSEELKQYGIQFILRSECLGELSFSSSRILVFCPPRQIKEPTPEQDFTPQPIIPSVP